MKFKDYYKILELDTYKVSKEDIKIAYRRLAKQYHPDININDTLAEEKFKDVNEAYNVLMDNGKKRKYDRMWVSYKSKNGFFDPSEFVKKYEVNTGAFSEFFEIFFGKKEEKKEGFSIKKNNVSLVGEDIETEIEITLEDAFFGTTKTLAFRTAKGTMKNITVKIRGVLDKTNQLLESFVGYSKNKIINILVGDMNRYYDDAAAISILEDDGLSDIGYYFTEEEALYAVNNSIANWREQALMKTKGLVDGYKGYSLVGLFTELKNDLFNDREMKYAFDNFNADWRKEALKRAKYLLGDDDGITKECLIEALRSARFTEDEIKFAVEASAADWNYQAIKRANTCLESASYSKNGLIDKLEDDGFTYEQAQFGVENSNMFKQDE